MRNNFTKKINFNLNTLLVLNKKTFSVFSKLRDYLKSGSQSSASIFGNFNPDAIQTEYDDMLSSKKTKIKGEHSNLSTEEQKLVEKLPKHIISNFK
jgi:hypothetical protein